MDDSISEMDDLKTSVREVTKEFERLRMNLVKANELIELNITTNGKENKNKKDNQKEA